jgi:hypothetical protein
MTRYHHLFQWLAVGLIPGGNHSHAVGKFWGIVGTEYSGYSSIRGQTGQSPIHTAWRLAQPFPLPTLGFPHPRRVLGDSVGQSDAAAPAFALFGSWEHIRQSYFSKIRKTAVFNRQSQITNHKFPKQFPNQPRISSTETNHLAASRAIIAPFSFKLYHDESVTITLLSKILC